MITSSTYLCTVELKHKTNMKKNLKYYVHSIKRNFKKPVAITDECIACGKCLKICPIPGCISASKPYHIDADKCMRCAKCIAACPVGAILRPK